MNKNLVNSEEEFVGLFSEVDSNEVEQFLDIEFAFADGKYQSDLDEDSSIDEDQDIRRDMYRKNDPDIFPDHYPCVVIWAIEKDFDRCGSLRFEALDYIYLKDFES